MNWKDYFKNITQQVKLKSKDKSTQIGAIIVGVDNEIVSTGYNSFPRGINDDVEERHERPEKYYWFEHAERNAIYNAARIGVSTKGCTMYLTCGCPCADCARGIINAGISKVVMEKGRPITSAKGTQWDEHAQRSLIMFKEAGVELEYYEEEKSNLVWLIERIDTHEWYCPYFGFRVHTFGMGWNEIRGLCTWTKDPTSLLLKKFNTKKEAEEYLSFNDDIDFDLKCIITEHEYIPKPVIYPSNQLITKGMKPSTNN